MLACLLIVAATNPALNQPLWERFECSWGNPTRVELQTPGGPLPFVVELATAIQDDLYVYRQEIEIPFPFLGARIHNGGDPLYVTPPTGGPGGDGGGNARGTWIFEQYDSRMDGEGWAGCVFFGTLAELMLGGTWTKQRSDGVVQVPFTMEAVESIDDRFDPISDAAAAAPFTGRWSVDFSSTDNPAIGVFDVNADHIATGTFLTTTGDYRSLAGRVDGDLMRLSTFDGAHAFLFHARMQEDGTIAGDFWSGNWHHETWTGVRDDDAQLPDAFTQTTPRDRKP